MNKKKMIGIVVLPYKNKTDKRDYIKLFPSGAMKLEFKMRLDGDNKPWFHCETWSKTIIDLIEKDAFIELIDYEPRRDVWQNKDNLEWKDKMYIQVNEIRLIEKVSGANMKDFQVEEGKDEWKIEDKKTPFSTNETVDIDWLGDIVDEE